jgi:hypothetical protein
MYIAMKKQLSLLTLLALGTSVVMAGDLELSQVFNKSLEYGYTENQNISVVGFQSGTNTQTKDFLIKTPILISNGDSPVGDYYVLLGKKPMINYEKGDNVLNLKNELLELPVYSTMDIEGSVDIKITAEQASGSTYYGIVVPVDDNVLYGKHSKEFCFNFSTQKYAEGEACSTFDNPEGVMVANTNDTIPSDEEDSEHDAAGANMALADISHTVEGKKITLSWTALPGSDNVEIKLFDKAKADYVTLATVPMSQEKYEYTYDDATQEFLFAFIPRDSKGKEIRYDVNVREETDVKPEITTVPATGPVENMLIMASLTVLLYAGYKFLAKRQAE